MLLNVRVPREGRSADGAGGCRRDRARRGARSAGQGRLLVRYSGTEPLLRVMLEGRDEDEIRAWAQEIIDAVKEQLG